MTPEPSSPNGPLPPGIVNAYAYYGIQNIFRTYLGIQCTLILPEDRENWQPLFASRTFLRPHHFEQFFGRIAQRDAYNEAHFGRLLKGSGTLLGTHMGFSDLFTPLRSGGRCVGFLLTGAFRTVPLEAEELKALWRAITGREATVQDPEFMDYVRVGLETPVLNERTLRGLRELTEQLAVLVVGGDFAEVLRRVDVLRREVFGPEMPHWYWVDWAVAQNKFFSRDGQGETLSAWEREEIGVSRLPTTVLAVGPLEGGVRPGPLETRVRAYHLQREAFLLARRFPETVGHALEDHGAIFLTSPDPRKNAVQARLEVRDRARAVVAALERKLRTRLAVGIGNTSRMGRQLSASYREAVQALHFCVHAGRPLLFYDEMSPEKTGKGALSLNEAAERLVEAYVRGSGASFRLARDRFVKQTLLDGTAGVEVLRSQFQSVLYGLLKAFRRRHAPGEQESRALAESLESRLEEPGGTPRLLEAFRSVLETLQAYGQRSAGVRSRVRIEGVRRYVDEHFAEPLTLSGLARTFGVSVPTFLRNFRRMVGKTFVTHLTGRRLEEARRLLSTTSMPLEAVAQACGFSSANYFVQVFKKAFRTTPARYRARNR
jgi:AraC-like DNA-binding protein